MKADENSVRGRKRRWRYHLRSWFIATFLLGIVFLVAAQWIASERLRRSRVVRVYPVQKLLTFRPTAGGVQLDFDSLITDIQQAVEPNSWEQAGGIGKIQGYENNLSLVITQTPSAHTALERYFEERTAQASPSK